MSCPQVSYSALAVLLLAASAGRAAGGAAAPLPPTGGVPSEAITLCVVPDTQYFGPRDPLPGAQVQWCLDQRKAYNIRFVTQLGDTADHSSLRANMENVRAAMDRSTPVLARSVVPGNHDVGGTPAEWKNFLEVFHDDWHRASLAYGGASPALAGSTSPRESQGLNHYQFVTGSDGRIQYLHFGLEWEGDDPWIGAWVSEVLAEHPGVPAIVSLHKGGVPMGATQARCRNPRRPPVADLWNNVVNREGNEAIFLVIGGHWILPGEECHDQRARNRKGWTVNYVTTNFQQRQQVAGTALVTVDPQADSIAVKTWLVGLGEWETDRNSEYTLRNAGVRVRFGVARPASPPVDSN